MESDTADNAGEAETPAAAAAADPQIDGDEAAQQDAPAASEAEGEAAVAAAEEVAAAAPAAAEEAAPDPKIALLAQLRGIRDRAGLAAKQLDLQGLGHALHDMAQMVHDLISGH